MNQIMPIHSFTYSLSSYMALVTPDTWLTSFILHAVNNQGSSFTKTDHSLHLHTTHQPHMLHILSGSNSWWYANCLTRHILLYSCISLIYRAMNPFLSQWRSQVNLAMYSWDGGSDGGGERAWPCVCVSVSEYVCVRGSYCAGEK